MPEVETDFGYAHFWWLFRTIKFALPLVHKYGIYLAVCDETMYDLNKRCMTLISEGYLTRILHA